VDLERKPRAGRRVAAGRGFFLCPTQSPLPPRMRSAPSPACGRGDSRRERRFVARMELRSPDGAKRNPGRTFPPRDCSRIPLRSMRATKKSYPRDLACPHIAIRLDPRGALHEASCRADRGRWPRMGATRTPNARRLKSHGPGAPAARHTGPIGRTPYQRRRPSGVLGPEQRWIAKSVHRGPCEGKPKTPRAGRRRHGGLAVSVESRTASFRERPFRLIVARWSGPWVR
jgi:hypothetical protein